MNTLRFKLLDPLGVVTFGAESVRNWESVKVAMSRNDRYRGLMRKFTGEIEFANDIRNRLLQIIDIYGINAEIYLTVYVGNGNGDLFSYKVIGSGALKADTTTTGISELGIKFNFVSTGFEEKLFNRDDTEVEYSQLKTIDGEMLIFMAGIFSLFLIGFTLVVVEMVKSMNDKTDKFFKERKIKKDENND
jgi:hypothetical protein